MRGLKHLCLAILGVVFVCGVSVGVENNTVRLRLAEEKVRIQPSGELETDTTGEAVERDFSLGEEESKGKRWTFSLSNRINRDSNPNVLNVGEEEDWADVLNLTAGGKLFTRGIHEVGAQYTFYGEFYQETEDRDIAGHIADFYYSWMGDPLTLRIDYMYSYFILAEEPYMFKHTVAPTLFYVSGKMTMEMVRLAVSSNEYPEAEALDGSDWQFQLTHYQFLDAAKKKMLSIGYKYASNDADDDNEDYNAHTVSADIKWPLWWQMIATVGFSWTGKDFGNNQEDTKVKYDLDILKPINKTWSVALGYENIDNDSNDATSKYKRNLVYLSLSAAF